MTLPKKLSIAFLVIFVCFASDIYSKRVVFAALDQKAIEQNVFNPAIEVTGFFNLVKVYNTGVSFGLFSDYENSRVIFSVINIMIVLALFTWMLFIKKTSMIIAISLVIGGALGNLYERIFDGAVSDFLDFHVLGYHWPSFNLADSYVFIGVFMVLLEDFIFNKSNKENEQN